MGLITPLQGLIGHRDAAPRRRTLARQAPASKSNLSFEEGDLQNSKTAALELEAAGLQLKTTNLQLKTASRQHKTARRQHKTARLEHTAVKTHD